MDAQWLTESEYTGGDSAKDANVSKYGVGGNFAAGVITATSFSWWWGNHFPNPSATSYNMQGDKPSYYTDQGGLWFKVPA
jgi:hypothetical protein